MVKDLTREAPRSPRERVGLYAIVGRMIDKARASLAGTAGDYRANSSLDHRLLDWKGIGWEPFRAEIVAGSTDEDVVRFLNENGLEKSPEEIVEWSDRLEGYRPGAEAAEPEREWFFAACASLGLDPQTTSLFDYFEADDRASFGGADE